MTGAGIFEKWKFTAAYLEDTKEDLWWEVGAIHRYADYKLNR
jgi:hypothetical protein